MSWHSPHIQTSCKRDEIQLWNSRAALNLSNVTISPNGGNIQHKKYSKITDCESEWNLKICMVSAVFSFKTVVHTSQMIPWCYSGSSKSLRSSLIHCFQIIPSALIGWKSYENNWRHRILCIIARWRYFSINLQVTTSSYFLVKFAYISLIDFVWCYINVTAVKLYPKFPRSTLRTQSVSGRSNYCTRISYNTTWSRLWERTLASNFTSLIQLCLWPYVYTVSWPHPHVARAQTRRIAHSMRVVPSATYVCRSSSLFLLPDAGQSLPDVGHGLAGQGGDLSHSLIHHELPVGGQRGQVLPGRDRNGTVVGGGGLMPLVYRDRGLLGGLLYTAASLPFHCEHTIHRTTAHANLMQTVSLQRATPEVTTWQWCNIATCSKVPRGNASRWLYNIWLNRHPPRLAGVCLLFTW